MELHQLQSTRVFLRLMCYRRAPVATAADDEDGGDGAYYRPNGI